MELTSLQARCVKQAVDSIIVEQRDCAILNVLKMDYTENTRITGYCRNKILNAITKSLSGIFFLSHDAMRKDAHKELADYLVANTNDLSLWYQE